MNEDKGLVLVGIFYGLALSLAIYNESFAMLSFVGVVVFITLIMTFHMVHIKNKQSEKSE